MFLEIYADRPPPLGIVFHTYTIANNDISLNSNLTHPMKIGTALDTCYIEPLRLTNV